MRIIQETDDPQLAIRRLVEVVDDADDGRRRRTDDDELFKHEPPGIPPGEEYYKPSTRESHIGRADLGRRRAAYGPAVPRVRGRAAHWCLSTAIAGGPV